MKLKQLFENNERNGILKAIHNGRMSQDYSDYEDAESYGDGVAGSIMNQLTKLLRKHPEGKWILLNIPYDMDEVDYSDYEDAESYGDGIASAARDSVDKYFRAEV